jgi:hypothetical protein
MLGWMFGFMFGFLFANVHIFLNYFSLYQNCDECFTYLSCTLGW